MSLGELSDLSSGKAFKKREYSDHGIPLLQIANVSFGKVIWDNRAYLPNSYLKKYSELILKSGDVLMALNRPILKGKLKIGVMREKDAPAILYQRVGRFDFYDSSVNTYVFYYLQSPSFIKKLTLLLQGVDQPFINKPKLLEIPIPLCSLREQTIIVEEIERQLSILENSEFVVERNLMRAEMLRKSIMNTAFLGRLIPQDPNDEPASTVNRKDSERKSEGKACGESELRS